MLPSHILVTRNRENVLVYLTESRIYVFMATAFRNRAFDVCSPTYVQVEDINKGVLADL